MRFLKEIFLGVLLLSGLTGRGTFHIHGSYDLDEDGKPDIFTSAEAVYVATADQTVAAANSGDIDGDGTPELIAEIDQDYPILDLQEIYDGATLELKWVLPSGYYNNSGMMIPFVKNMLSPFFDFTSKTPSPISRIETSNVPPPKS